jgi:hypothetical protein
MKVYVMMTPKTSKSQVGADFLLWLGKLSHMRFLKSQKIIFPLLLTRPIGLSTGGVSHT